MSDEGMDPCECIWSHEMAMRRLISWLRQSQSYCTDTECIDDMSSLPGQGPGGSFLMMTLLAAFAVAMFMMRPAALRNQPGDAKPYNQDGAGPSGAPPTPPPASL